jgi:hypothetical protein
MLEVKEVTVKGAFWKWLPAERLREEGNLRDLQQRIR